MSKKPMLHNNGISHKILLMSKFYKREVSYLDIRELNPIMSRNFSDLKRPLFRLECHGLIVFTDQQKTKWKITPAGISHLYLMTEMKKIANKNKV